MTEHEDVFPDWIDGKDTVSPGQYIWCVHVEGCLFQDQEREKPYAKLFCVVFEGDQSGHKFEYRLYFHKQAKGWANYFLKKFEYPPDLLEAQTPILRQSAIEGLQGKMLVELYEDPKWGLTHDVKGFDHLVGTELEEKTKKQEEVQLAGTDKEPVIDVFGDVALDSLDGLSALDGLDTREPGNEG